MSRKPKREAIAGITERGRLPIVAGGTGLYLRALLEVDGEGRQTVRAFEDQDSSLISVFAAANALIRLMPKADALDEGALVDVLRLDDAE